MSQPSDDDRDAALEARELPLVDMPEEELQARLREMGVGEPISFDVVFPPPQDLHIALVPAEERTRRIALEALLEGAALDYAFLANSFNQVTRVSTETLRESLRAIHEVQLQYAIDQVGVNGLQERIAHMDHAFASLQETLHQCEEALLEAEDRRLRLLDFQRVVQACYQRGHHGGEVALLWVDDCLQELMDLPLHEGADHAPWNDPYYDERGTDGQPATDPAP